MSEKMDRKFFGVIVKEKDGTIVPPDQWMCFLNKDDAFPATLRFYYEECMRVGAAAEQLSAVSQAIARMEKWRMDNPGLCKVPDVRPNELMK